MTLMIILKVSYCRKRKSESLRPEDFDGEWTDVETRCKIGIEGHGIPK